MIHSDRATLQPWGVKGGGAGLGSIWILNPDTPSERVLPGKADSIPVQQGDVLRVLSPGGGGWGDPLERDPEAVELDVMRRLVSVEKAKDDYGVVFEDSSNGNSPKVNEAATTAMRDEIRNSRPSLKLFNRGANFYSLVEKGEIELTTSDEGLELVT